MLMQMSLKKGGADRDLHKALHYLLMPEDELQQVAKESQSFGHWLGDYIECRKHTDALAPLNGAADVTEERRGRQGRA